mgnify:CR=1 FL=1
MNFSLYGFFGLVCWGEKKQDLWDNKGILSKGGEEL